MSRSVAIGADKMQAHTVHVAIAAYAHLQILSLSFARAQVKTGVINVSCLAASVLSVCVAHFFESRRCLIVSFRFNALPETFGTSCATVRISDCILDLRLAPTPTIPAPVSTATQVECSTLPGLGIAAGCLFWACVLNFLKVIYIFA